MTSPLRATALLGSSSAVSIVIGLFAAKTWSTLLGPSGLGFMGLLHSLIGIVGLIVSVGIGTGMVRAGAPALAQNDHARITALRRAAWILFWTLCCGHDNPSFPMAEGVHCTIH